MHASIRHLFAVSKRHRQIDAVFRQSLYVFGGESLEIGNREDFTIRLNIPFAVAADEVSNRGPPSDKVTRITWNEKFRIPVFPGPGVSSVITRKGLLTMPFNVSAEGTGVRELEGRGRLRK